MDKISPVQLAAMRAQAPFQTTSMKSMTPGVDYFGPPKYMTQRDAPLDIPPEVAKKLFAAMDVDMDDRISIEELGNYVQSSGVPITPDIVMAMFREASSQRGIIHEAQRHAGLTLEEIQYAVRGRYSLNHNTKEWGVSYRPCRDYWILLLLTVNDRLFALQVPKVIPSKIRAQFEEQEQIAAMHESLQRGEITFKKPEGIDRKYASVRALR